MKVTDRVWKDVDGQSEKLVYKNSIVKSTVDIQQKF
jgi:hypothetical protein